MLQFCDCLGYLNDLRGIFGMIDVNHSGTIDARELHTAFQHSGANMDAETIMLIVKEHTTGNELSFDDFVELRLEWDYYISAWDAHTGGNSTITPEHLLQVLDQIKQSLEPVQDAFRPQVGALDLPRMLMSMNLQTRTFQPKTCELLILSFGNGYLNVNFEQFCRMMVFVKDVQIAFTTVDANHDGGLDIVELTRAFNAMGMAFGEDLVSRIGQRFDANNSGKIEFDEFIQMMAEWKPVHVGVQSQFQSTERLNAEELQKILGSVRVVQFTLLGNVQELCRAFNLNACRWLIAVFGSCLPGSGEAFATGVTYAEFCSLVEWMKDASSKFERFDTSKVGRVRATDFGPALAAMGIRSLTAEVIDCILKSYDVSETGTLVFDEFLLMLIECQLYAICFQTRAVTPNVLTPFNLASPRMAPPLLAGSTSSPIISPRIIEGSSGGTAAAAATMDVSFSSPGVVMSPFDNLRRIQAGVAPAATVTLDVNAFFSLVFAVPRHLARS
eukprot:NODE_4645_length_1865_cov_8.027618.p1 GENE.NODE_4645_length_1865_cov_8.027618~~NODE_4645_length_1865_cov_8.027618.p1  ORF type:complete len:555 (-),score=155.66 NODE_4645_length_1865_cov_8.027618:201-1700(-)